MSRRFLHILSFFTVPPACLSAVFLHDARDNGSKLLWSTAGQLFYLSIKPVTFFLWYAGGDSSIGSSLLPCLLTPAFPLTFWFQSLLSNALLHAKLYFLLKHPNLNLWVWNSSRELLWELQHNFFMRPFSLGPNKLSQVYIFWCGRKEGYQE